ncbi:MAG: (2Fe-2S)-binding protein [Pseudomonadota bacterium]|uniref:(2Fe-2S)-binding protein n=1 Tax=Herminiimonas arsenitoxidans TaxID=1809410 RepID=UPI00097032EB|nr:(2Fe-2S)-binding protein [Herminiimonas arsenitoxidans]
MIVCVCSNVSERKIRQAVDNGTTSMTQLRNELEVGTCCGKCHSCAKRVLRECLADARPSQSIMFHPNALAA